VILGLLLVFSILNREDLEDRKEDIFVGSVLIVHARSCAGWITLTVLFLLYGLLSPNRQFDAQLLPYPSPDLIVRELKEPKKFTSRSSRSSRFKIEKTNQRHLFIEPDMMQSISNLISMRLPTFDFGASAALFAAIQILLMTGAVCKDYISRHRSYPINPQKERRTE